MHSNKKTDSVTLHCFYPYHCDQFSMTNCKWINWLSSVHEYKLPVTVDVAVCTVNETKAESSSDLIPTAES